MYTSGRHHTTTSEVKFRAWDEDGYMFFPTAIEFNKTHEGDTWVWKEGIFGQDGSAVILMQWTGLKDKNGKDIYVGDILKNKHGSHFLVSWPYDSMYVGPNERWVGCSPDYGERGILYLVFEKSEVVGNRYQNPELIVKDRWQKEKEERDSLLEKIISKMDDRDKDMLRKRFAMGDEYKHTLDELAKSNSITRERVRQIEAKAIDELGKLQKR
jgi:uncharacterized phage protein (TIGR01671 family)